MKASKVKELIKQSLLELEAEKKNTSNSGPMTPEEEEMIKRYEEEEANKYALEKEEPLEEGDVMKKAREIVAKHKEMTEGVEGPEDISDYDRGKIETGKANTLARSINAAIVGVDPELHVETFAKGVAQVLKREYGSHLTKEFIAALRDNLRGYEDIVTEADRIVESWKRKNLLKESKRKDRKILKESADSAVNKHSASLLKALGARAKYPEDEIAYRKVEKHLKAIATELGLDASLPFMEDEMYSGKAKPEEALEYTKEMFNSWLEDSGMTESKKKGRKALKENLDLLDQYLSIIQSNDMDSDQAHNYLENQGLDPQQIDSIMNHAFPTSSDSYEESDYMKRRKRDLYEVSEGMGDEKWITPDEVESDYSFYSDMYKGVYGVRPHGQSAEQLCNWLNSEFKLEGNRIVRKDGQDELYEVNEGMGDEKWASDGGYYTKPDTSITVSKETADLINQTIEEFKRDIQDESESVMVDKTEKGQINLKIIRDLQKNWNISFEHDTEDGKQSFYWVSPNQSMEDLNDGLENAWQLFYDRVQKKLNESSEDFIKSIVDQFPEAVEEYGFENVESAFEQMYENAWENARAGFMYPGRADTEEATDYATKEVLKTVKFFKKTPGELESYIEEMIEMRG